MVNKTLNQKITFMITFDVVSNSTDISIMPETFDGAIVSCYSRDTNFDTAFIRIVQDLENQGLIVSKLINPVNLVESTWDDHVKEQWSNYTSTLPSGDEFEEKMDSGGVIYSPFAGYTK
jgi:hypothetical protein